MSQKSRPHPSEESLLAFLDGEVSLTDRRSIRNHLQVCWRCRSSLRNLEAQIEIAFRLLAQTSERDAQRLMSARQRMLRWIRSFELRAGSDSYRERCHTVTDWLAVGLTP
jgi:anti-sigma factor RsiW